MLGSIFDKNKSLSSYLFLVLFLIIIALFFIEIFQQDKNDVNDVSIFNSEDSATKIQDMNFTNATQVFFISQNLFDNNKINQSEVYALFSLKLNPNLTQTHNLLFDIYLRKNEHVEAKLYLLNAYKLDPNKVRTKVDFGKLLIAQNKYDDAIEVFKKIINEHPNDPYAFNYLGYAYYFLNDYENAKKYFNK